MEAIGAIFREKREELELSVFEVSQKTQIRTHIIRAIEDEEFSLLPSVYIKSFIKTYADFLGIPNETSKEIIDFLVKEGKIEQQRYKQNPNIVTSTTSQSQRYKKKQSLKKKQNLLNGIFISAIFSALVLLIYFTVFYEPSTDTGNSGTELAGDLNNDDTSELKDQTNNLIAFFDKPDSLLLEAYATDTAWIRLDIDGKTIEETRLMPNQTGRWSAKEFFLITCGNAGVVEFKRNGEKLAPLGQVGKVVRRVKITEKEVTHLSKPWKKNTSRTEKKTENENNRPKLLQPSKLEDFQEDNKLKKEDVQ